MGEVKLSCRFAVPCRHYSGLPSAQYACRFAAHPDQPRRAWRCQYPRRYQWVHPGPTCQPTTWKNGQNQLVQGTLGEYLQTQGINTSTTVGGPGSIGAASQPPAPPSAPGGPQPPLPAIGNPLQPNGRATFRPGGRAQRATGRPYAGAGGHAHCCPAPGVADVQQQSINAYTQDVATGTSTSLPAQISSLQELLAAAPNAQTGPAAGQLATLRALGAQFGVNVGTDQASQEQVMNKATAMLVAGNLSGLGQATDAKMVEAMAATPNSKLTQDAVKTTGAMTYGNLLFQKTLPMPPKIGFRHKVAPRFSIRNSNSVMPNLRQARWCLVCNICHPPPQNRYALTSKLCPQEISTSWIRKLTF